MMCLSRTTGYAIQALGCMNSAEHSTHQIATIAKDAGVPKPYLAKIIGALSRHGLVVAKRGFHGGIALARPAQEISFLEIVEAVEGKQWLGACLLGFENCAHHAVCPTQTFWRHMRRELTKELSQLSLAELLAVKPRKPTLATQSRPSSAKPNRKWPEQLVCQL
jgi:Rrf2 family transcriptional regulator, iron-sulfur cluster assembly transcription factor